MANRSGNSLLREIDSLLRDRDQLLNAIREEHNIGDLCRRLAVATVALAAIYGVGVGLFKPILQVLFVPIKIPLLLLVPLALTLPALYVANALSGARLSFGQTAALGLLMTTSTALVLAAATPLDILMILTIRDVEWIRMGNLLIMAVAGVFGARILRSALSYLEPEEKPASSGSNGPASQSDAASTGSTGVWLIWLALYAFAAVQIAWLLRPYVASRFEGIPPFMRDIHTYGSIFDWIGAFFRKLYGYD